MLQIFAIKNCPIKYGIGLTLVYLQKYTIIGVRVRITISFEVKVVNTLLRKQNAKNNFLPEDPDLLAALKDKYAKNPVKSIEMHT